MRMTLFRRAPIVLLMLLLCAPTLCALTGFPKVPPLEEYRKLAEPPKLADFFVAGRADFLGFTAQTNRWYSDQFPTRAFWVRLYTQIMYSVFRTSDQVHIGADGWLFYRSIIDTQTPALEQITPEARLKIVGNFARLAEILEDRGITLYVMPTTQKHYFYPERLPASAAHAKRFAFYDAFMNDAAADGRINMIDSRPVLAQAKRDGVKIYHQTDFHWTDPAGAIALAPLVADIARRDGKPRIAEMWVWKTTPMPDLLGGQARALPLFRAPTEDSIGIEAISPATTIAHIVDQDGVEWRGAADPPNGELLSPVFVYGDSYFDAGSRAGFFSLFQSFARARSGKNDLTAAFRLRQPGTKYMVIEFIAPSVLGIDASVGALVAALESDPAL